MSSVAGRAGFWRRGSSSCANTAVEVRHRGGACVRVHYRGPPKTSSEAAGAVAENDLIGGSRIVAARGAKKHVQVAICSRNGGA